jgi:serine/threonine protein kinase
MERASPAEYVSVSATRKEPAPIGEIAMPGENDLTGAGPTPTPDIREAATFVPNYPDTQADPANASDTFPAPTNFANLDEFSGALVEIGLISLAELESFAADSAEGVLGLSRALVKAGKLTPYQAAAVYQKKSRGLLIGNYLILDKLGQGGMGVVFKARHRRLGRVGALKILPPSFARDRDAVMRFRREVEAAGRLKHPNLVAAQDADEDRGVHFLVMDYVEGRDLDRIVQDRGPMQVSQAIDCMIQAARGLEAAHAQGIVHRDIKPGNLMLDNSGTVRVLDLGLARIVDAGNPFSKSVAGRLTQSGMYMGTIDYMAPEQAEDSHRVDHRADIYSLGCTLYYLLTGREPFPAETVLKRLMAHMERPAPSLRLARPDVPVALDEAYEKMMAKQPGGRPASMTELIALLEAAKSAAPAAQGLGTAPPKSKPDLKVFDEANLKRAGAPRTKAEPSILARPKEAEELVMGKEISLEDLVMDVRPEARPAPSPAAPKPRTSDAPALKRLAMAPPHRRQKNSRLMIVGAAATILAAAAVAGLVVSRRGDTAAPNVARVPAASPEPSVAAANDPPPPTPPAAPPARDIANLAALPKRESPAKAAPKAASAGPYWILLAAGNKHEGNIPSEMDQKLKELSSKNQEAKWAAFAPGDGWAILHGRNGIESHNIPDEAYRKILELGDPKQNAEIRSITFSPDGGWVILHGRNGFAEKNIPEDVAKALPLARAQGSELKSVAFGPGGACVVLYGSNRFYHSRISNDLLITLRDAQFPANSCFLGPDGLWVILQAGTNNGRPRWTYAGGGPQIPNYGAETPYVKLTDLYEKGQFKCYSYAFPVPAPTVASPTPTPSAVVVGTSAINKRLDEPLSMRFPTATQLVDVLTYIRKATKKGPDDPGIPIHVSPIGLQEVGRTMRSTVTIDSDGVPLKTTLKQVVGQLGMDYHVDDNVLIISARRELVQMKRDTVAVAADTSAATNAVLRKLAEPIPMSFGYSTPLSDVLKYIRTATRKSAGDPELKVSVDPVALQRVEKTMVSTIQNIELEGVPLRTSLRLLLRQLNLVYTVKNGTLVISSIDRIRSAHSPKQ